MTKIKDALKNQNCRAVVLTCKRVLCLCYTLLHERVFLHYFHLNQYTSLRHLTRASFVRQLNQLKIQSTLRNIGDTYLKRFLANVFQTSAVTTSKAKIKIARYEESYYNYCYYCHHSSCYCYFHYNWYCNYHHCYQILLLSVLFFVIFIVKLFK